MLCHPVQKRDNFKCQYCGKDGLASLNNWHDSTIDHVLPQRHGGTDELENLVTSCGYCNSIKGDRLFDNLDEARKYVQQRRGELEKDYQKVLAEIRGCNPMTDEERRIALLDPHLRRLEIKLEVLVNYLSASPISPLAQPEGRQGYENAVKHALENQGLKE